METTKTSNTKLHWVKQFFFFIIKWSSLKRDLVPLRFLLAKRMCHMVQSVWCKRAWNAVDMHATVKSVLQKDFLESISIGEPHREIHKNFFYYFIIFFVLLFDFFL